MSRRKRERVRKPEHRKKRFLDKLRDSPIEYFSDLFIVAMVLFWIADNVWESVIATAVTVSSIFLSMQTGMQMYDTSMWSSIGANVAIPLSAGGALWMIKNGVQHAIRNHKGEECPSDFPRIEAPGEYDGQEEPLFQEEKESEEE